MMSSFVTNVLFRVGRNRDFCGAFLVITTIYLLIYEAISPLAAIVYNSIFLIELYVLLKSLKKATFERKHICNSF